MTATILRFPVRPVPPTDDGPGPYAPVLALRAVQEPVAAPEMAVAA